MTEKEYNQCVSQYADNVYRFILKNLGHKEDAQDIVQTAFEKSIFANGLNIRTYNVGIRFSNW
jgi:DNA-directed RNA polymerase specialized sigma24 family protein